GRAVGGRHFVQVHLAEEVEALAADVGGFHHRVRHHLTLHRQVPLPVVRVGRDGLERVGGRAERGGRVAADRGRRVQGAGGGRATGEGRVLTHAQARAYAIALVEAADAGADGGLAVAVDVPGDADAGRDPERLDRDQGAVRSVAAARQAEGRAG